MNRLLGVAMLVAVSVGWCQVARAGDGLYFAAWAGDWYPRYSLYARESIPYFAEHPPVYYSHAVARPYGYSPYAYPPTVLTPDPALTRNPYCAGTPVASTARVEPLVIRNPYVTK